MLNHISVHCQEMPSKAFLDAFKEIEYTQTGLTGDGILTLESYDYLNSIHIDYRGLIEKGLALEAPKGMYEVY